jgi:hypothetical protein
MMDIAATIKGAAALVTSIGVIGGGAYYMDERHAGQKEFDQYVSSNRVQTILSLAEQARREGSPPYLCSALQAEFAALCTEIPEHYFCNADSQRQIMAKAGC